MGVSDTAGFILYRVIYGSVQVLPVAGYSVHGYGCGVGKSNPRVTYFKPYPQLKDKPRDAQLQLSDADIFMKAERDVSPKEYPSFCSLHDLLHIYFNVIMHHLITAGSQPALLQFAHGSSKYMSGLYKLYLEFEWPQVLEYHFRFHNRRIVKMQEGSYGGWEHVDVDLMSLHLFSHPKTCLPKQNMQPAWSNP